eukprot:TRINITY_DN11438_c0_g1_i2.p1 TRINITY_DN11438_c0_g1~~TRINITY_DN11438_c0_g1_i2.p1  ORF type:complete len:183 (-),score=29.76 TRINITY_DN11438_c0_g1_i2:32-580(-)
MCIRDRSDAGKTSLVDRLVLGVYNPHTPATVSVDPHRKDLIIDQREWNLDIYDTPGQERFRAIAQSSYVGADAVAVVYSVADRSSFEQVNYWLDHVTRNCASAFPRVLVGSKADSSGRVVTKAEGQAAAEGHNVPFFETSSMEDMGIEEMFIGLVRAVVEWRENPTPELEPVQGSGAGGFCM